MVIAHNRYLKISFYYFISTLFIAPIDRDFFLNISYLNVIFEKMWTYLVIAPGPSIMKSRLESKKLNNVTILF